MRTTLIGMALAATIGVSILFFFPIAASAHCDTLAGPVVTAAKKALEKGDVTPVLKWVKKEQEEEIRAAFKKTMAVRSKNPEAKELADMYFLETLVRIHRAGEGAPYTGLSAGPVEPVIAEADRALEGGSVDHLLKYLTEAVAAGIRKRFAQTQEGKKRADESIEAGREFVEAYVELTHYVERLYNEATGKPADHGKGEVGSHQH